MQYGNNRSMSGYGRQVISNERNQRRNVYPFYEPQEVDHNMSAPAMNQYSYSPQPQHAPSMMPMAPQFYPPMPPPPFMRSSYSNGPRKPNYNNEIASIERQIRDKRKVNYENRMLASMENMMNVMAQPRDNQNDMMMAELVRGMQKQQETIAAMIMRQNQPAPPQPIFVPPDYHNYPSIPKPPQEQQVKDNPEHYYQPREQKESLEDVYGKLQSDKKAMKNILKELDIDEEDEVVKFDDNLDFEYDPEASEQEKSRILDRIAKEKEQRDRNRRKRCTGASRFRAVVYVVLLHLVLRKMIKSRKMRQRVQSLNDMKDGIKLFKDVVRTYLIKTCRAPISSVLSDPKLDLSVVGKSPNQQNVLKLRVRIAGIIDALTKDIDLIQTPILLFLDRLTATGAFIPDTFLVPFEQSRLDIDEFGTLIDNHQARQVMMIAFYFLTKIFIKNVLLKPIENGLQIASGNKRILDNLKMIASVLQMFILVVFISVGRDSAQLANDEAEIASRKRGKPLGPDNNDGVSDLLFSFKDMEQFVLISRAWIEEQKEKLFNWASGVIKAANKVKYMNKKK